MSTTSTNWKRYWLIIKYINNYGKWTFITKSIFSINIYDPCVGGERDFDGPAWISNRKLNSFWKKKATTKMTLNKEKTVYREMSACTSTRNYKKVSVDFSIK